MNPLKVFKTVKDTSGVSELIASEASAKDQLIHWKHSLLGFNYYLKGISLLIAPYNWG